MSEGIDKQDVQCVAVIQCHIAHERCTGSHCAITFARREHKFAGYGSNVLYVPFTCGGCPGRRVSRLLPQLRKSITRSGYDPQKLVVHLASCVVTDNGHYPPCPHVVYMKKILERKGMRVVEGSYISQKAERRRQEGGY